MNLSAIRPRKSDTEAQAATETARRNIGASNGNLLFRDTRPVIEAVAKGLQEAIPVKPVALAAPAGPSGDLVSVLKAMTDGFTSAAAAVRGSVQKGQPTAPAAAPKAASTASVAPAIAVRHTGNPPSVPMQTATQLRREADTREEARKAAAREEADRVIVQKSGPRVLTFRKLDATLTDAALAALNHIVGAWEKAERRPVRVYATDLSRALDIPLATAQAAFTELVDKRLIISSKNSAGVLLVMPGLGVTGS